MPSNKHSLLWKLEKAGLPGPSYLFGTMHVRPHDGLPVLDKVAEVLPTCAVFAAEVDMDFAPGVMASNVSMNQISIRANLREKQYNRLRNIIRKATDIDIATVDLLPPMFTITMISSAMLQEGDEVVHLDRNLWEKAKSLGLELAGLETAEDQVRILFKISPGQQVKLLRDLGQNIGKYRRHLLKMNSLYEQEDIYGLYKGTKQNMGALRKPLIYIRNRKMADSILRITQEKTLFAAVGAAHLAGRKGLLRMLKQDGFKLSPYLALADK